MTFRKHVSRNPTIIYGLSYRIAWRTIAMFKMTQVNGEVHATYFKTRETKVQTFSISYSCSYLSMVLSFHLLFEVSNHNSSTIPTHKALHSHLDELGCG